MENTERKQEKWLVDIDFSKLMDLRVDYAFKLIFGSGDTSFLIFYFHLEKASKISYNKVWDCKRSNLKF